MTRMRRGFARPLTRTPKQLVALSILAAGTGAIAQQPPIRALDRQEVVDMVVGTGIYCSRGLDTAGLIAKVDAAVARGQRLRMISPADMPDDWLAFTSFGIGGGGAWPEVIRRHEAMGIKVTYDQVRPERALADYLGKRFDATFSAEAGQFVGSLLTAARLGIPLIDGDPSARCLPEVQMSPFYLLGGLTRAPLAGETPYGDIFIIPKVRDERRVEEMTRALAMASGGGVDIAGNALTAKVLKRYLDPGFHSRAGRLGRAARLATAAGHDPVAAIVAEAHGYLLFRGRVASSQTKGEGGFGWTEATLTGTGRFAGSSYRIFNKNENMIAWRDGKLDAAAPDIIAALDPKTGWAMRGSTATIGGYVVGQDLAIVGIPAVPLWRQPTMIAEVGPRHFGFPIDYMPLERLHRR